MAKITRFTQKIFGSLAGGSQIAKFGSLFAGSPAFTTDPNDAQSLSNWLTGWLAAAIGGNAPAIEDVNAVEFVFASQLAYLGQAGVPEWIADTTYYTGSFASDGAGGLFISITDNNLDNALTDVANWRRFGGNESIASKSANYSLTPNNKTILGDSSGGVFTLTMPVPTNIQGATFTIKKVDSSSNAINVVVSGGFIEGLSTYSISEQYQFVTLIAYGSGYYIVAAG